MNFILYLVRQLFNMIKQLYSTENIEVIENFSHPSLIWGFVPAYPHLI